MKKFVCTLVVSSVLAGSFANAQAVPGVSGPAMGNQTVITPGNYNQTTLDQTKVALALIDKQAGIAAEDRAYLKEVIARLSDHLNNQSTGLIALQRKFAELGLKSQTTNTVTLAQFLELKNKIESKNSILESEIQTSTMITREQLPSYEPLNAAGAQVSALQSGNVNLSVPMQRFESLRQNIMTAANNVQFGMVQTPLNQLVKFDVGSSLNPNLQGLQILSHRDIQTYRNDIAELSSLMPQTKVAANQSVEFTVSLIRNFVNNYGNSEWLRGKDENDNKARAEAYQAITNAFYTRSYLRSKFGVRIGAIQTAPYNKSKFNIEKYGLQPLKEALGSFRNQAALTDVELQQAFENVRNFIQVYDEKITPVFKNKKAILARADKKEDFSSNDTGLLVRANSLWTKVTGQTRIAEGLLMIMRLALADVREEMMLARGEVLEQQAYHDKRFRALPEMKQAANKKICMINYNMPMSSFTKNCGPLGFKKPARASDRTSILGITQTLFGQLNDVEVARSNEARLKQELIDSAKNAGDPSAAETDADDDFN